MPIDSISTHLIELARLYEASARPISNAFLLMAPLSLQQLPGASLLMLLAATPSCTFLYASCISPQLFAACLTF